MPAGVVEVLVLVVLVLVVVVEVLVVEVLVVVLVVEVWMGSVSILPQRAIAGLLTVVVETGPLLWYRQDLTSKVSWPFCGVSVRV